MQQYSSLLREPRCSSIHPYSRNLAIVVFILTPGTQLQQYSSLLQEPSYSSIHPYSRNLAIVVFILAPGTQIQQYSSLLQEPRYSSIHPYSRNLDVCSIHPYSRNLDKVVFFLVTKSKKYLSFLWIQDIIVCILTLKPRLCSKNILKYFSKIQFQLQNKDPLQSLILLSNLIM